MKNAIYPLSADPIHNGHGYNLSVAVNSGLFDKVYVAIGHNSKKNYTFNDKEREYLAKKAIYSANIPADKVKVGTFTGILRNHARNNGIKTVIRGFRTSFDSDYERLLANFNRQYGLETFVVPSNPLYEDHSSTLVKSVVCEAGLVHDYVHPAVKQALEERMRDYSLVGVTGCMGAGKTTFCKKFSEYANCYGLKVKHIDFDSLVKSFYTGNSPLDHEVREEIRNNFGDDVFNGEELNTKKLSGIVFGNEKNRYKLAEILNTPSRIRLEDTLYNCSGIVLIDAAYFTEYNLLPWVNNNVILVNCENDERFKRIYNRNKISKEDLEKITYSQHTNIEKRKIITETRRESGHGFFYEIDTTFGTKEEDYDLLIEKIRNNFPILETQLKHPMMEEVFVNG
jgi:pantetheine-phosphate adenylyltransferase